MTPQQEIAKAARVPLSMVQQAYFGSEGVWEIV